MRFFGFLVIPILLVVLLGFALHGALKLTAGAVSSGDAPASVARGGEAHQSSVLPVPPQSGTSGNVLTPEEVRSFCSDGPDGSCASHRFEVMREGNNTITHMTTGPAVTLTIPAGVFVDAWVPSGRNGCDTVSHLTGPTTFAACEATFRRFS